jgi:hypothetical protein
MEGHLRLSYATGEEQIVRGMDLLEQALARL